MRAVQELGFAPDHAKWSVSGCWETPGSLVCRNCRRPGHGLKDRWTSKEVACWHIAWHRSTLCPTKHTTSLCPSVGPGRAQPRDPARQAVWTRPPCFWQKRGEPWAWRCSPSAPKNWPWSVLFICTDIVVSSRDFFFVAWTQRLDIAGSHFLSTKSCLSHRRHYPCPLGLWWWDGERCMATWLHRAVFCLGIMQRYAQLWRMCLQSHSSSDEMLLELLPFLKSSKRKCQWLESILQHGSLYSIREALSLLCGKRGLWLFPEPHMVEGRSDMILLCGLGGILSKAQPRVHRTWPFIVRNLTWTGASRHILEPTAWYQPAWERASLEKQGGLAEFEKPLVSLRDWTFVLPQWLWDSSGTCPRSFLLPAPPSGFL